MQISKTPQKCNVTRCKTKGNADTFQQYTEDENAVFAQLLHDCVIISTFRLMMPESIN